MIEHDRDSNSNGALPADWTVARLGDTGRVRYGLGQPPEQAEDGVAMIRATNIKRGRIAIEGLIRIKREAIPQGRNPFLKPGDIIVVRSGAYTGDVAMVTPDWAGSVAGYDLIFTPSPKIDPAFCAFNLLGNAVQAYFRSQRDRSAQPHLNRQQLEETRIPLPPIAEQRAIAHLLQTVQHARQATEKVIAAARQLKQSLLRHLFTYGPVPVEQADRVSLRETEFGAVPRHWGRVALSECAIVQTGVAKGRKLNGAETISVPYLRVANVQDGHLDLSEMKQIAIRRSEIERYSLRPGDVVLTEGGDFDKLGRGFIWNGQVAECVHQNHIFAVRADRRLLIPEFLAYLTQSAYGKAYFLSVAHKTTNLACINTTKLKAFPALIPPMPVQQEVIRCLRALDRKIDREEKKRGALDCLFRTLLHELMTGRLRAVNVAC